MTLDPAASAAEHDPAGGPSSSGHVAADEFAVRYDPIPAAARVARAHGWVRSRLFSLVATVVVLGAAYRWVPGADSPVSQLLMAVLVGISVAWLIGAVVSERRSRQYLASLGEGIALRVTRQGVEVAGTTVSWGDVVALTSAKGRIGEGPNLVVRRRAGEPLRVPFSQLDSLPAGIDGAVRAYSGGRFGVDLSALD